MCCCSPSYFLLFARMLRPSSSEELKLVLVGVRICAHVVDDVLRSSCMLYIKKSCFLLFLSSYVSVRWIAEYMFYSGKLFRCTWKNSTGTASSKQKTKKQQPKANNEKQTIKWIIPARCPVMAQPFFSLQEHHRQTAFTYARLHLGSSSCSIKGSIKSSSVASCARRVDLLVDLNL